MTTMTVQRKKFVSGNGRIEAAATARSQLAQPTWGH